MRSVKMKLLYGVTASLLALTVAACGAAASVPPSEVAYELAESEPQATEGMVEEAPGEPTSRAADYATIERMIIRQASLSLVVPDTEAALDEISALVNEMDGYIVESNLNKYQEGLRASVTLRVPAERFDAVLQRIRDLATEVRHENVSGEDVTKDYVDLQSRLRYLEATEERLLEFLEAAEDTEAALAVYEDLREIQADIEQVKGQMQYLEQSAAMATIRLDITPDELAQPIQVGGWHPEGTLRNALQTLIRVLQFLVDAAIVIVVLVIPVLIVVAVPFVGLFFLVRAIVRKRRARKAD